MTHLESLEATMKLLLRASTMILAMATTGASSSSSSSSSPFQPHWALYPKTYVAPRTNVPLLDNLDGDLTKHVWRDVPFSDDFDDIRGATDAPPQDRPDPSTRTRFKAIWDDTHLYIGALMENGRSDLPTQAHFTQRNSPIFQKDSDFEIFVDVNGGCHHYKEFEVNALNTVWNLMLDRPYADGGMEHSGRVARPDEPLFYEVYGQRSAARVVRGSLNDASGHGATWSIEVALSHQDLWAYVVRTSDTNQKQKRQPKDMDAPSLPPTIGSMLRINFSRVERQGDINWTWQPQIAWDPSRRCFSGFVDMHRPDAWGYFVLGGGDDGAALPPRDPTWPGRLAAMNMYYAQQVYFEKNGKQSYASSVEELDNLLDEAIVAPFEVAIQRSNNQTAFVATVTGNPDGSTVTITQDRFLVAKSPDGTTADN